MTVAAWFPLRDRYSMGFMDLDEALRVLASLEKHEVEYVLVGGGAVTVGVVWVTAVMVGSVQPATQTTASTARAAAADPFRTSPPGPGYRCGRRHCR